MSWKIVKKGYSRNPWRIVVDGEIELASTCSRTGILVPVCGQTRAEVEAWLLDRCEWYATHAKLGILPVLYTRGWRNAAKISTLSTVGVRIPSEEIVREIQEQWGDLDE